jgi:hypothetical protein
MKASALEGIVLRIRQRNIFLLEGPALGQNIDYNIFLSYSNFIHS